MKVLAGATIAFVAACGTPAAVPFELPHHNQPAVAAGGVATGGILRFDGRCVWLEYESGGASNLIWPTGFRAFAPPLQIVGLSGRVVAREGDRLELGVGDAKAGVPGCPARGVFLVGELTRVNGMPRPDGDQSLVPRETRPIR